MFISIGVLFFQNCARIKFFSGDSNSDQQSSDSNSPLAEVVDDFPKAKIDYNDGLISGFSGQTCIVKDGGIVCWGIENSFFSSVTNDSKVSNLAEATSLNTTPRWIIPKQSGATFVKKMGLYTCAVVRAGVKCWGQITARETIDSSGISNFDQFYYVLTPSWIPGLGEGSGIDRLYESQGYFSICTQKKKSVLCWASPSYGNQAMVKKVGADLNPKAISFGTLNVKKSYIWHDLYFLTTEGRVYYKKRMASPDYNDKNYFSTGYFSENVTEITGFEDAVADMNNNCAVLKNGKINCWNGTDSQILGDYLINGVGLFSPRFIADYQSTHAIPADVSTFRRPTSDVYECAIQKGSEKVYCKGNALSSVDYLLYKDMQIPDQSVGLTVSHGYDACALTKSNKVYCMGLPGGGFQYQSSTVLTLMSNAELN